MLAALSEFSAPPDCYFCGQIIDTDDLVNDRARRILATPEMPQDYLGWCNYHINCYQAWIEAIQDTLPLSQDQQKIATVSGRHRRKRDR